MALQKGDVMAGSGRLVSSGENLVALRVLEQWPLVGR